MTVNFDETYVLVVGEMAIEARNVQAGSDGCITLDEIRAVLGADDDETLQIYQLQCDADPLGFGRAAETDEGFRNYLAGALIEQNPPFLPADIRGPLVITGGDARSPAGVVTLELLGADPDWLVENARFRELAELRKAAESADSETLDVADVLKRVHILEGLLANVSLDRVDQRRSQGE